MLTESSLIDLTRKKFETWVTHNSNQLTQLFDERGLLFGLEGEIETKDELMKKMNAKSCHLKDFSFENTIARIYGTSAVVHGVGEFVFTKAGKTESANMNFLDVWIERETGWKLVSTHYSSLT